MSIKFKINKSTLPILFISPFLFLVISCASPYLGSPVKLDHPMVCAFNDFPASCTYKTQLFKIDYTIKKTNNPGEYRIKGHANHLAGSSKTWVVYDKATFTLYLVNNGVIVETITIGGGHGSLDRSINFARNFTPENDFQATLINYRMDVRG